jgi:hypothetical protein
MNMIRLLSGKRFGRQLPPIKKHPRSITVLQDLFVALHNWMHEHNLLPLSHWGLGRGPSIGGSARMAPPSHETDVVQRLAMRRFFSELSPLFVRPGATCLEWDHVKYTQTIPSCKARWSFRYDQHRFGIDERKRVIRGDLQSVSNTSMLGGSFAASKFGASSLRLCRPQWRCTLRDASHTYTSRPAPLCPVLSTAQTW